ncbi:hypothetical protein [Streptomyces sp. JHA26]|uniref:hypothetical protein n=1 Tax=Streptomyces sp. JHA26 TaxID=1917143 RepID=UPI00098B6275|nr:hypothetical protein [Streptomyces sp. JHA26]
MNADQTEALLGMLVTFGLLVLMALPSVVGIVRERRIDRQIREAHEERERREAVSREEMRRTQKSSDRSTVPSTATWYAEGRRSKKLVNS